MHYEQDYILRMIQRVGAMLRVMIGALREHRPDDAIQVSAEALHHITGLSSGVAETLPAPTLLSLLTAGGRLEVRRCLLLAEVFGQRAAAFEMEGDVEHGVRDRATALALAEAALAEADGDDLERAEVLVEMLRTGEVAGAEE